MEFQAVYKAAKPRFLFLTNNRHVAIIAGRPFPKKVGELQWKLAERIQKDGFDQVIEAVYRLIKEQ